MKNTILALISIFFIGSLFAPMAEAGPRNKRMKRTQQRQMKRIHQGVRSGELTKKEARGLKRQQKRIHRERKEALSDDGMIDNQERRQIRRKQKRANRQIYKQKNDGQTQAE